MVDRELLEEALEQTLQYGSQLAETCSAVRDHFQQGRTEEGISLLKQFVEGMQLISYGLHLTQQLQRDKGIVIDLSRLPAALDPLVSALESKDYGLVGDILSYEIQPLLAAWSQEQAKAVPPPPM
jgi:hypothetical protein